MPDKEFGSGRSQREDMSAPEIRKVFEELGLSPDHQPSPEAPAPTAPMVHFTVSGDSQPFQIHR